MRAVRLTAAHRLDLVELPDPEPGEGEIVLRVAAAGICGSDLSCYKTGVFSGSVLGHEFSGIVERIGPGVEGFRAGEPVMVDPKVPCGRCDDCLRGAEYRCPEALTAGPGGMTAGAFAERVLVRGSCAFPLPDGLDVANACLVEPLAVAIHGIERAGGVAPGEDVVVIGLGPIGLLAVAALRARGAGTVTGVDPVEVRRKLAATLGADDAVPRIADAPSGVPLVLECSGRPEVLQDATNVASSGGRVSLLGVSMAQAEVMPMVWVTREMTVVGSIASSAADFRAAAELLGRDPGIARVITRRIGLDELPQAFEDLTVSPVDGKVVTEPSR